MKTIKDPLVHEYESLHRLALGTVQFGMPYGVANTQGQVSLGMAKAMVNLALAFGLNTIDTAIGYGESEEVLGKISVADFNVVSKLTALPEAIESPGDWVMREVEASLSRLKLDSLYGLLLHRSSDLAGPQGQEIYEAMVKLKSKGKVRKIGISIYSPDELDAFANIYDFDLIQAPFNLVDNRLHSSGWLKRMKSWGCEVHIRSIFLQGLLLMSPLTIPAKFCKWDEIWSIWHQWLLRHNEDPVRACLAYPLSFPEIDRVVVGANDLSQLQHIIAAAIQEPKYPLPDIICTDESLINPSKWQGF